MGVWEGPGVPHADLEAISVVAHGIKSTMYLHLPLDHCVAAGQHS